ncbi:MAG TPA: hypothetical protein VLB79_14740 [Solirubrobacterales bacterium]|nr:hypothetical protein [Solirubrobacterales bacterium]
MSEKRTVWVLDTETKGTGAEMVPLERLERERNRPKGGRERIRVISRDDPKVLDEPRQQAGERRIARRFKIVDVRSREALAEDVGLAEALETLRGVGGVVDVNVFIRHADDEDWHPLTLSERKTLWGFRDAV